MKTDDLIKALVADTVTAQPAISQTLTAAVAAGAFASLVYFLWQFGLRSDFSWVATNSPRFIFKFIVTLGVAIPAFLLVRQLARPEAAAGRSFWLLAVAPVLLAAAICCELIGIPRDHWAVYMIGSNSFACMTVIPMLSLAPLAAILYALRQGAPSNPALAGAAGGLLSAAIGATLYATHCVDDSPLFVGLWYPIGFAVMTALGAIIGSRVLKW